MKPWLKNSLSGLAVVAGGFVLFNLAFILAALVSAAYGAIFRLFSGSPGVNGSESHPSWIYVFLILILVLSWFVFKTKRLNDLIKAIYLTMPLMVVLMVIGIALYTLTQWVMAVIGVLIVGGIISYLYRTKRSWMYYFSTIYVGVVALYIMLSGLQI